MIKLFVYGTLKIGYKNHSEHLTNSEFLGVFKTVEKFPLIIANQRYSPVLLPEPGIGHHVTGELYAIDQDTLEHIDMLESTNKPNGYLRDTIEVIGLNHLTNVYCFCYFKKRENIDVIHSPYLETYSDTRYIKK